MATQTVPHEAIDEPEHRPEAVVVRVSASSRTGTLAFAAGASADDAVRGAEAVGAAGSDVHLFDDRAVSPPLGDQRRIGPDREDVCSGGVEDPLDADLELGRGGGRGAQRAPFVRRTAGRRSAVIRRQWGVLWCSGQGV